MLRSIMEPLTSFKVLLLGQLGKFQGIFSHSRLKSSHSANILNTYRLDWLLMVEISDVVKYTHWCIMHSPVHLLQSINNTISSSSYNFPLFGYFHLNQTSSMILTSSFASPLSLGWFNYLGTNRQHKVTVSHNSEH